VSGEAEVARDVATVVDEESVAAHAGHIAWHDASAQEVMAEVEVEATSDW